MVCWFKQSMKKAEIENDYDTVLYAKQDNLFGA